ncbi:ParB/RepB/Spo0J family partition protein [Lacicoccus alkaliphilus]|uniref:Chromosome partitioning protein, ParB family n=1 Tax=Lacicoccus alkaliphilus DSM 16010 TaxID=1123231 RepID=A0A1M7GFW1_9BACL|nr:ParB/RepB/Spo0J family partition protein [Salinicoccus alkaliphilus]SHM15252.1 chromosome partitioning protein, ParB family [Salinicoccus alkaliphilus DSM 16010]
MAGRNRLGKGLDALFNTDTAEAEAVTEVKLSEIRKNPYQPRVEFDPEKLEELADSIRTHGILQPIILRKSVKGYDIVAGERRYRAAGLAEMETITAIVKELSDDDMMELAIIENLQREDLNPLEEAMSYKQLMEKRSLTQAEVAERLGKSRPYIANMLRILNLPAAVKKLINEKKLSGAHGRTLLGLKDPVSQEAAAKKAVTEDMSVRALEEYVRSMQTMKKKKASQEKPKFLLRHESSLKEKFGTSVEIKKTRNKGQIAFEFKNEEEFNRLMKLFEES